MSHSVINLLRYLKYLAKYPDSEVSLGASIQGNSRLGEGAKIGEGTYVRNSVLGRNTILGKDCYVRNTIIERDSRLCSRAALSDVKMGAYSYISQGSRFGMTVIGRFCSIGGSVICGRGSHPDHFPSSSPVFYSTERQCGVTFADRDYFQERKEIVIGNDVWIGDLVFIRDGVRIGNGAIIGAGAVVVKDIPDYAIVGGVPAEVIRFRFSKDVAGELLEIEWWNWQEERLRKAQPHFAQGDIRRFIEWAHAEERIGHETCAH